MENLSPRWRTHGDPPHVFLGRHKCYDLYVTNSNRSGKPLRLHLHYGNSVFAHVSVLLNFDKETDTYSFNYIADDFNSNSRLEAFREALRRMAIKKYDEQVGDALERLRA